MTYKNRIRVINYINGLSHGDRPVPLFSYEILEAVSFAAKAENVLIIGYGTETITEAILKVDSLQKIGSSPFHIEFSKS